MRQRSTRLCIALALVLGSWAGTPPAPDPGGEADAEALPLEPFGTVNGLQPMARLVDVRGEVRVFNREAEGWTPAKKGRLLYPFEVLGTGFGARAEVHFFETGKRVNMAAATFLAIPPRGGEFFPKDPEAALAGR